MSILKKLLLFGVLLGLSALLLACSEQGPAERAGEKVDEAVESIQESLDPDGPAEEAGEQVDEAVEGVTGNN
jgi:ABC-type oligopeptide transport system substrate-binding subunit